MIVSEIRNFLFENADEKYRIFQKKLMPNVEIGCIIGVRTPILRQYANTLSKREDISLFLNDLPHKYYDEMNLHGFIISKIKDFDIAVKRVTEFLPFVDNWATCDQLRPKAFDKNKERLKPEIYKWLSSEKVYTVRFGIEMAMTYFLDDDFDSELSEKISRIRSDEYYVNMMIAWYFATALAKKWDDTIYIIKDKKLDVWTHNKTIQKAIESFRITDENKSLLRGEKI